LIYALSHNTDLSGTLFENNKVLLDIKMNVMQYIQHVEYHRADFQKYAILTKT